MAVPSRVTLFLVVGLVAASQSGNLVRLGDAHPVAMAAWRLTLASLLLAPIAGRRLAELRALSRRDVTFLVLAGLALSAHLITWIAAVQRTTVANAAIFFAINPVLTAVAAHFLFRERLTAKLFLSIGLGLAGVAVIGWTDLDLNPAHLGGNGLALLCSAFFTLYFLLGKNLRQKLDNRAYVVALYGVAGAAGFVCVAVLGLPFFAYDGRTYLAFFGLALIPTMIGHTAFNHSLRYIDAGRISAATLSEPPLAGLVAWLAWGERIGWNTAAGYVLIAASVLVLVLDRTGLRTDAISAIQGTAGGGRGSPAP